MQGDHAFAKIIDCLSYCQGKIRVDEINSSKHPEQNVICGELVVHLHGGKTVAGKAVSIQLYSSSEVNPDTGKGKLSQKVHLKHGKRQKGVKNEQGTKTSEYKLKFIVEPEFGMPGAFLIRNEHKHKFFLQTMSLQAPYDQTIHFECNSWIYPFHLTNEDRIFFLNKCYLPHQTPDGLVELRKEELLKLRGNGNGERKEWDRIYEYDKYNDLGKPDRGSEYARPVLGGSELYPYPRRLRTGRSSTYSDFRTESQPESLYLEPYVPPDERLSCIKLAQLVSSVIEAGVHFVLPEVESMFKEESSHFESFNEIYQLFSSERRKAADEWVMKLLKTAVPDHLFRKIKQTIRMNHVKFPLPGVIAENKYAWMDDSEFGRQMLAGINPTVIQCIQRFPPTSRYGAKSSIKPSDIEHNLEGLTLEEAINQWRIFILDHHDYLMPFLNRINTKGICAYASRTLLFLRNDSTLKPLVIELSLPGPSPSKEINRVFRPATDGIERALWHLAKAHVAVNDSGYHQLINHWLRTHAVIEPFIIATRRQLSVMHPVHQFLHPHFKDILHVNALARSLAINSGGILEKTLFSGSVSMEMSSALYAEWRFDEQSLPIDLIKRGMALYDPDSPESIRLLFEDYPFAKDGVEIWIAIKNWVTEFCLHFYQNDDSLKSDSEIQEWWSEIRNIGHSDMCDETWWYSMTTLQDLVETLTTLIWTVSALHAALNLGQYEYAGFPPNRPTLCRKYIPNEGTREFAEFLIDPDRYYLNMLPQRFEMTLSIALLEVLSVHRSEESYLGQQLSSRWIDNELVQQSFNRFMNELREVEKRITRRNQNPNLKNRRGPASIAYEFLCPDITNMRSPICTRGRGL